jgi:spore coat-associated protein N
MSKVSFVWRFRRGQLLIVAVLLLLAASAVVGTGAVFTASSNNPVNAFSAGVLKHTNSKLGLFVLTAAKMKPTDTVTGTLTITNTGDFTSDFSIAKSNLVDTTGVLDVLYTGALSNVLTLKIDSGGTSVLAATKLNALPASISLPPTTAGGWLAGETHTYMFTVSFPDGGVPSGIQPSGDNLFQGNSTTIDFTVNQVQH